MAKTQLTKVDPWVNCELPVALLACVASEVSIRVMVATEATEEGTTGRSTLEGAIAVYNAGVYINGYVPVDLAMGVFAIRGQNRSTQKAVVGAGELEAAIRGHQSDKNEESGKFHN